MEIKGFCHTNLDDYKREEWPTVFCCPPREGDCVLSKDRQLLKICRITHTTEPRTYQHPEDGVIPVLDIELHKVVGG